MQQQQQAPQVPIVPVQPKLETQEIKINEVDCRLHNINYQERALTFLMNCYWRGPPQRVLQPDGSVVEKPNRQAVFQKVITLNRKESCEIFNFDKATQVCMEKAGFSEPQPEEKEGSAKSETMQKMDEDSTAGPLLKKAL